MHEILFENQQVEIVQGRSRSLALIVAIIFVRQLPPKEFLRIIVSKDQRQGTTLLAPLMFQVRQVITLSRQWRVRLIFLAQYCISPVTSVFLILSDPERSTRWMVLVVLISLPFFLVSSRILKMQWDRVDQSFIGVLQTTLLVSPSISIPKASLRFFSSCTVRFSRWVSPSASLRCMILDKSSRFLYSLSLPSGHRSQPVPLQIWKKLAQTDIVSVVLFSISWNRKSNVRGMIPLSSKSVSLPVIVYVFPLPV